MVPREIGVRSLFWTGDARWSRRLFFFAIDECLFTDALAQTCSSKPKCPPPWAHGCVKGVVGLQPVGWLGGALAFKRRKWGHLGCVLSWLLFSWQSTWREKGSVWAHNPKRHGREVQRQGIERAARLYPQKAESTECMLAAAQRTSPFLYSLEPPAQGMVPAAVMKGLNQVRIVIKNSDSPSQAHPGTWLLGDSRLCPDDN